MPLWGKNDAASNSCLFVPQQVNKAPTATNRNNMYANVTAGAFVANKVTGQFAASTAELANTSGESKKLAHAGWHLRTQGTGSLLSIAITAGGTGYANADTWRISTGTTNATGTLTTNATGGITSLVITNPGAGFKAQSPTATITTGAGTGATLTGTIGGRVGRVHYECLVAMGTITGDGADDTQLPE